MTINGINGVNTQIEQMGMNQATDSYSRNIQNQIENAQKQLQELSSNEDMSLEEKMKKRQEIQQQISDLNVQLRQHQTEQRREKQQAKGSLFEKAVLKNGNEGTSIKVSISKEGRESYRNSLQENSESFNDVVEKRNELLAGEKTPKILVNYGFEFGSKLNAIKKDGEYQSIEDRASDLLMAYASIYDEIVQGHESGTREKYVEDSTSESGYRKLTMSEEISMLDDAYKKYADFLESNVQQYPEIYESYSKHLDQLARIGVRSELGYRALETLARYIDEGIPENISGKLVEASKSFVAKYLNKNVKNISIESLLEGIKIFE